VETFFNNSGSQFIFSLAISNPVNLYRGDDDDDARQRRTTMTMGGDCETKQKNQNGTG
jgi:hypothetical protein